MSAETSRDVSLIQDEDVLRKMWQDTEDFGRKKEIRAHMYKLREARLRDFYNTGEVTSETKQTSTTIKESSTSKGGCELPTHADSLADHSFLSLKTKEIRDSESPTRDVAYKISGGPSRLGDQGWNIVSTNESSADGKTHSTTRIATTSGTEPIEGGLSKYGAKTEQKATVYRDGDDKNYVKSVGADSQSVIKQEASGGDENSKFYTTSTSTSSSSKYTSEQKSTSGDPVYIPERILEHRLVEDADIGVFSRTNQTSSRNVTQRKATSEDVDFESAPKSTTSTTVVRKTYTTDAPNELKQHPGYIDGKTKVITETKTLPDGSTMTTTRYETKGGKTTSSSTSQSYSTSSRHISNEQKSSSVSSSNKTDTHRNVKDSRITGNNEDITVIKYVVPDTPDVTTNQDVKQNFTSSTSTTSSVKVIKNQDVISDSKTVNVNVEHGNFIDDKEIKRIEDVKLIGRDVHKDNITKRIVTEGDLPNRNIDTKTIHTEQIIIVPSEQLSDKPVNQTTRTVKTTVVKTVGTKHDDQKVVSDDFINVERQRNITEQTKIIPTKTIETVEYIKPSEPSTPLSEYEPKIVREPIKSRPIEPEPAKVEREPIKSRPIEHEPAKFETPERRQLIKPGRSELDDKPVPTDGQYDTTYRTDYVNRRISVEVSPTHDAFARSLRAVTPERDSKIGSTRSLRTNSSTSLRNSTSPEKYIDRRQPSRSSPDTCRPVSPSKKSPSGKTSPDKLTSVTVTRTNNRYDSNITDVTRKRKDDVIVNTTVIKSVPDRKSPDRKPYSTDTLTRKKKITDDTSTKITTVETCDGNTLTKRTTKPTKPRSRSNSPTSTASEIEYFRNTDVITDLDVDDTTTINAVTTRTSRKQTEDIRTTEKRPSTLDITTTKVTKTLTDYSPVTSPRKQTPPPVKESPKSKEVPRYKSPTKEPDTSSLERPPKYFSVSPKDDKPKDKVFKRTDTYEERCRQILGITDKKTTNDTSVITKKTDRPKSPEKKPSSPATSPTKELPRKPALPDAARRPASKSPEKPSSPSKIQEFPSQIRRSPEKQPTEKYPEKTKPVKAGPKIQEFPSQIRKSPEKQPLEKPEQRPKQIKTTSKINEFPSQTRKSPEKGLDRPDKPEQEPFRPKEAAKIKEFPSQMRRTPECVSLDDLPINRSPYYESPDEFPAETRLTINEFPSQIRKSPEREPLQEYPEKSKPTKTVPTVNEFPAQVRKSPEKVPLEEYPERTKPTKTAPTINEFPSQIRTSPEKQPLDEYPEKSKPTKTAPTINEFPSQIRKSAERQPLEEYPEKSKPTKTAPTINEFPSQTRKSPEKQPLDEYPEKTKPTKTAPTINEFPSQIRKSPEKHLLEEYPEKSKPTKTAPTVNEFPSQIRKSPEKQPLEEYPEKSKPTKTAPTINEFPSQIRKSPEKQPLEDYPGKTKPLKLAPTISEFPSQIRTSPEKEPVGDYPERTKPSKTSSSINEFPSQIRKSPDREPLEEYPEKPKQLKPVPTINEFPAQTRKPSKDLPSRKTERVEEFIENERLDTDIKTVEMTDERISETIDRKKTTDVFLNKGRTDVTTVITTTTKKGRKRRPRIDGEDSESTTDDDEEEEICDEDDYTLTERVETDIVEQTTRDRKSPVKDVKQPTVRETVEIDIVEKTFPVGKKDVGKPRAQPLPNESQKAPTKEPQKPKTPKTQEYPSLVKKSPQKEKVQSPPEKQKPRKDAPTVQEFPSQIRKAPQREPLEPYPEKVKPSKAEPKIKEFPSQIRKAPEKEPLESSPQKTIPRKEAPVPTTKAPGFENKPDEIFRPRNEPEEELVTVTHRTELETRVPVEEVLVTKKFIDVLCQEEETDRRLTQTDETKQKETVTTKRLQTVRGIPPGEVKPHKTVKKDSPGKYSPVTKTPDRKEASANLIKKERIDTDVSVTKTKKDVTKLSPKTLTPVKKSPITKSPDQSTVKRTTVTKTIHHDDTKFTGVSEYTDEYTKVTTTKDIRIKQTPIERNVKKITTTVRKPKKDDDNLSDTEDDRRTKPQKTTTTYTTRATKVIQNGEMPKTVVLTITHGKTKPKDAPKIQKTPVKEPLRQPISPTKKPEQPKHPDDETIKVDRNFYNTQQARKTVSKVTEIKQTRPVTKTVHKTFEVQSPKRHVVSTIINIKPKTKPESAPVKKTTEKSVITTTTKTTKVSPKATLTTKPTKQTNRAKPIQNGHIPSDDETEESDTEVVEQTHITKTTENLKTQRTDTTQTKDKITRTVSDQVIKTPRKTPVRGASKPELISKIEEPVDKKQKPEKNIITTKSILIENAVADEREIIVDLKRSKSSREETPDRTGPYPVPTNDDTGVPRYPDHITEPDDIRRSAPKRLSDIPLTESEDVTEFTRVTDITEDRSQRVSKTVSEDTDERLLSVNEKINIYLNQRDKKPKDTLKTVQKPKYEADLEDDECLLSVSDKVNKFITTAEQLTVKDIPQRPKSPKLQNVEDETVSRVSEKVSQFTEKVQQPVRPKDGIAPRVPRPDLSEVDESIRSDECLLSVSDKVTKFISTAEKLTTPEYKKPVSLSKLESVGKTRSPSPKKDIPIECVIVETDDQTYSRRSISPEKSPRRDSPKQQSPIRKALESSPVRQITESPRQQTPERRPSNIYAKKPSDDVTKPRRDSFEPTETPRSSRRTSQEEPKTVLSPTGRLRSTETIRKAKALFENINVKQEVSKQRDILSRPSVFEGRRTRKPDTELSPKTKPKEELTLEVEKRKIDTRRKDVCTKLTYEEDDDVAGTTKTFVRKTNLDADDGLKSTRLVMEGLKSPTSPEKEIYRPKQPRSRSSTPEGDMPHYMLPLDRTVRARSPHYENIKQLEETMTRSTSSEQYEEVDNKTTKFGVTLRRTDSGRAIITRRKSSTTTTENPTGELDVESIYDLQVLESLLEKIVGYDIRRRIRAQIRIVKRLIEEDKLETVVTKVTTKTSTSPVRDSPRRSAERSPVKYTSKPQEIQVTRTRKSSPDNKSYQHSETITQRGTVEKTSEYRSSYAYSERRTSSEMRTDRRSVSPETKTIIRSTSPDYKVVRNISPDSKRSQSPDKEPKTKTRLSPERKTSATEATRVFQTELKKTRPISKSVVSEKPEWVTQRTLRKVSETIPPVKKTTTSTKTTTTTTSRKETRSSSPPKGTDIITSSYGVGPTDENGSPLFGLKALRAQNKSEKTKVQGTVIRSQYYAENGQEPMGEISVTKYSTDPKDLDTENLVSNAKGITSVTTTQKFGYKGTPALKTIGSKKKQITDVDDDVKSRTSEKVTRRGSVKEMSQKFIENAVETSKNERQSSYPKAGLILRTSSFRDAASSGTGSSREGSPGMQEICETVTTVKSSKSSSAKADTFLTNKSRVTGVQDVITRMKNEDVEAGESQEDAEARNLLNKFIGAQVILTGMESHVTRPSSGVRTTTTKVTTTTSDGGKPKTVIRTFTHPITEELLETVWDQQTLKLLLEQSTDYEDRRIIRARLRQVMAEQEACAELVEKASEECEKKDSGSIQGESLLLPLLQGLLDAPETEQTADSGTESGEDLRSGLILEVQNALVKLSTSLKSDSNDVSPERRDSLLQLISRLQVGLSTQLTPSSSSERRASLQTRFGKRKQRAARHTVGVTTEELEDARRLMQEIALRDNLFATSTVTPPEYSPLQKQHSEGSVVQTPPSKQLKQQKIKPVKNLTAKPFISSTNTSQSQSGTSSTVDTPTETSESLDFLTSPEKSQTDIPQQETPQVVLRDKKPQHAQYHQSMSFEPEKPPAIQRRPLSEAVSLDYSREVDLKSVQKAVTQAAAIKQLSQLKSDVSESTQESETDDDPVTVKVVSQQPEIINKPQIQDVPVVHNPPLQPQPDLILQTNPVYQQPDNSDTENDDCSSQYNEKANRFNSKKLKMKRANTIDIPKPLKYYEYDDDESEGEHDLNARRNSYLALRGPISVGRKFNAGKKVPEFQPKTDSDHKFVAFLNKHNENTDANKASIWAKQQDKNSTNWTNKFGNIRTAFEKVRGETSSSVNSARSFWKSADDAMSAGKVSHFGPKISRQSARNLQNMFEEKQKQTQQTTPWSTASNRNIVTGSLKVDTKAFEGNKNVKVVTQPNSVNKFSHAPISAFKPVPKKAELPFNQVQVQTQITPDLQNRSMKTQILTVPSNTQYDVSDNQDIADSRDGPLFLYSPKPLSPESSTTSPIPNSTPWGSKSGESRVLSIAASKFQNKAAPEQTIVSQRRPSREKIVIPSTLQQVAQPEKLTAPYLVKNLGQGNSVKKLSGQYDNLETKNSSKYSQPPSFLRYNHTPHTQKPMPKQFLPNQNYTIYYGQPRNNPPYYNEPSKTHPFSPQSNTQHFIPQTYPADQSGYSERNEAEPLQANTFQADVAVHQRQYHKSQNVPQHRYSQPQVYQNQFPEYQENSEPQYTSSYQFKPQHNKQPNYVSNNADQYYESPKQPSSQQYVISHQQQRLPDTNQSYQQPSQQYISRQQQRLPDTYQSSQQPSQQYISHQQQRLPETYQSDQQLFTSYIQPAYSEKFPKGPSEAYQSVYSERADVQEKHPPPEPLTIFDHPSPPLSPQNRPKYEKQISQESVTEYTAVSSKVMSGPVSQQAVTVQQNAPKSRDQHDMDAAFNLKASLEKISKIEQRSSSERKHSLSSQSFKIKAPIEKPKESDAPTGGHVVYNNVSRSPRSQNKVPPPDFYVNDKPVSLESLEINERGESVLTSKFHIPVKTADQNITPGQVLSRSESWHQICQGSFSQKNKPSAKASPNSRSVSRSKSSHTLALPKQFEAGMSKAEMSEKRRSVEAYFGETGKTETKKTSINRVKTSQKVSTQRQNSEKVTTHKSFSEGPVTTTQVTTKVTNQQQVTKKPLSPFAKFKQLDKQNSLNSPPSTPKTPTGGGPLFKFTDPALSRSASTVKERLLQWCQMKTKEYENIQLDNFSTSWADGLAFCALIHHFLPDAFDYRALNPKNRRHNFTLAFQVADEKADIAPLLDVDDMVATRKPDWKCVFTYVQSIYRRFKDED